MFKDQKKNKYVCVFSADTNFLQGFLSMAIESMGDRGHIHREQAMYMLAPYLFCLFGEP